MTQTSRRLTAGFLFLFTHLIVSTMSTSPVHAENYDCEMAVAFVVDTSGSMDEELGSIKQSLKRLVDNIPHARWNVGLATFPNIGIPAWDIRILTHGEGGNDGSLKVAIDRLSASGASPLQQGMLLASTMLLRDQLRPRVMVILTDGRVCFPSADNPNACNELVATAEWLKNEENDITIVSAGKNLNEAELNIMRSLSSDGPDGEKLARATTSGLGATLVGIGDQICDFAEIGLEIDRKQIFLARGGVGSGNYVASWNYGDDPVYVSISGMSLGGGLTLTPEGRTNFQLGSSLSRVGNKWNVIVPDNFGYGTSELTLSLRRQNTLNAPAVASRTVSVEVVPLTFQLTVSQLTRSGSGNQLVGTMTVTLSTDRPTEFSISCATSTLVRCALANFRARVDSATTTFNVPFAVIGSQLNTTASSYVTLYASAFGLTKGIRIEVPSTGLELPRK